MVRSQLLDSSPPVSSDGTLPLLWSSFQSDASSSSNSHFYLNSELAQLPLEPQISQVMNYSSLHSVPGAGLQIELELPSNQNLYGIVNAESWADQQIRIHQIVGMNHPWPFQMHVAQNQRVTVPEPVPISCLNCGTMVISGTQGKTTDGSMNGGSEEEERLPSVCSSTRSQKIMPMRQFSELNANKRQIEVIKLKEEEAMEERKQMRQLRENNVMKGTLYSMPIEFFASIRRWKIHKKDEVTTSMESVSNSAQAKNVENKEDEGLLVGTCFKDEGTSESWLEGICCSNHMIQIKEMFMNLKETLKPEVLIGKGSLIVKGKGSNVLETTQGTKVIEKALYVPHIYQILLSVGQLCEKIEDQRCDHKSI